MELSMTTAADSALFEARAYRDVGKWWTIEIPALTQPGPNGKTITAIGGAVTVKDLDQAARDLVAGWLDVEPDTVKVHVTVEVPAAIRELWDDGVKAEEEARAAVQRAAALRREAVHSLRAQGYTLDAAAAAFSITKQRAQQLATDTNRGTLAS